jgi:hypothetical protein
MPSTWGALNLKNGVRAGVFRACSFRCGDDASTKSQIVVERGHPIRSIRRIAVDEISVCPAGANPAACCWLVDEPIDGLPSHIRQLRASWSVGRLQARLAARAGRAPRVSARASTVQPKAKARPPADLMAKIDRIIALGRPDLLQAHPPAAGQVRALNARNGRRQGGGPGGWRR